MTQHLHNLASATRLLAASMWPTRLRRIDEPPFVIATVAPEPLEELQEFTKVEVPEGLENIPFVRCLLGYINGTHDLHVPAKMLLEAEITHGLHVMPATDLCAYPIWDGNKVPKGHPVDIDAMLALGESDFPDFIEVFSTRYRKATDHEVEHFEKRLRRFMDDIPLLLSGCYFTDYFFLCGSDGSLLETHTQRGWGYTVAEWANQTKALKRTSRAVQYRYEYTDFFLWDVPIISGYKSWEEAFYQCLELKDEMRRNTDRKDSVRNTGPGSNRTMGGDACSEIGNVNSSSS